jgi:hypothetical protein
MFFDIPHEEHMPKFSLKLLCSSNRRITLRKAALIGGARDGEMQVDPAPSAPFPGCVSQGDAPWRIK